MRAKIVKWAEGFVIMVTVHGRTPVYTYVTEEQLLAWVLRTEQGSR